MMTNKIVYTLGMSVFLLITFLVFTPEAGAQPRKDQRRAKQLVEEGDKAFAQKNYREAADRYQQSVMLVPNNAYAHYRKGFAHYYLKENDLALAEFDLALSQKYRPIEIYRVRSEVNGQLKNYDAAINDINQILILEPNSTDYFIALGEMYFAKGAYREALDSYQKAVVKFPNSGDLFFKIAQVQFNLGDAAGQASAAENALKKRTLFLGEAYALLGDANQKLKKFPEAIDAYQRALSAKPDQNVIFYRNLAELYRASSRFDDSINISKKALLLYPNDGSIYTDISWYYSLADRHEDAVQAALAGIRYLPDQYLAYTNLCRAYNDTKRPELAISACNNALRLSPNDGETNFYLGRSYALTKRPAEASRYYKKAIPGLITYTTNIPDSSDGFYLLGNAYFEDEQLEKAVEAYRKCLELNPRFARARFNLGLIAYIQRNRVAALEHYNKLLSLDKSLADKLKAEIDKL